ncbi:MAG: RNA polymerase sigma factor [Planctomycetota bacterium]|nr:RNA polymerase sigma factor [Planctomycetota bacterium]
MFPSETKDRDGYRPVGDGAGGPCDGDEALFLRFRDKGDETAMEMLMERHSSAAFAYALAVLGEPHAAEDAVQDAVLNMIRAGHTFRAGFRFARWFYGILRNRCRDELRRRGRAALRGDDSPPPVPGAAGGPAVVAFDPTWRIEAEETAEEVAKAFASLDEDARDILTLRFARGLDMGDIAAILGVSREAAKKRLQRAIAQLRDRLAPAGRRADPPGE